MSAKDVILEMLRRHGVAGGVGRIIEYYGPGLRCLSAMDRHVIANMGAELGATTTVFPSDDEARRFLAGKARAATGGELVADAGADYDDEDAIDLSELEPLIAHAVEPGQRRAGARGRGREIYQAYIGSSANPGYRDFAIAAEIVRGKHVSDRVSFDVNPTSREMLENLDRRWPPQRAAARGRAHPPGRLQRLHRHGPGAGDRAESACARCRATFPAARARARIRCISCRPETAAASALAGRITDPRTLETACPGS